MSQDASPRPDNGTTGERSFVQRLFSFTSSDLLRIVFLCLIVGLILAAFNVDPAELWVDFFGTLSESIRSVVSTVLGSADRAIEYFLLGAVIVLPIWVLMRILGAMKRN